MKPNEDEKLVRILIVDDEPDVETLIRQRFKRRTAGFEFVFARNGKEALDRLESDPDVDVVVTDINMPVMDGLALLSRLGGLDRIVKAVILSAYGDMTNIRSAMNGGAFDFLTKPIDFRDFETTLRRTHEALAVAREGEQARETLSAIERELEIAARIQASILKGDFEFSGRSDFDVFAQMTPARGVGGDFYDFYLVDDNRLGFTVGDVSGKGIPAALFMAVSRTLLQAIGQQGITPAECFAYANRVLGAQGAPGVFVTAFFGILNTTTGELEFCLGGHNPPYRISGGEIHRIEEPGSMVIGLLPAAQYETGRVQLTPGDSIVLFTDGVTEAIDAEGHFFGERRLKQVLAENGGRPSEEIVKTVHRAVAGFTGEAPTSDDITVMAVRWKPAMPGEPRPL